LAPSADDRRWPDVTLADQPAMVNPIDVKAAGQAGFGTARRP
jgi:hypothetical protein